jgi:hypothetical protein
MAEADALLMIRQEPALQKPRHALCSRFVFGERPLPEDIPVYRFKGHHGVRRN